MKTHTFILPASLLMAALASVESAKGAVITLIPTEDTYTLQSSATTNFNASTTLEQGATIGGTARSTLLRFDASSVATVAQADIVSVQLRLTLVSTTNASVNPTVASINALNDGNSDWTNSGATWNTRDGTNPWVGKEGARNIATDTFGSLATISVPGSTAANTEFLITLSPTSFAASVDTWEELFDNWTDGTSNGLVLYNSGSIGGVQTFHSRESLTESFRPALIVTTIPEPSSTALIGLLAGLTLILHRRR